MDGTGAGERLRIALELFEFGVAMARQRIRREHPTAAESEIDLLLDRWLLHPPGAADGDCSAPLLLRTL